MAKINEQDKIEVMEDDVEAVRKLPDVYIGALGNAGFKNMYREIIQNALDEIMKGNTLDFIISVSFDERTKACIIEDRGQGIDIPMLPKVFSVLHSSSNYNKVDGSGKYSSGKNGMGGTITNYLSKIFIAESYRLDGNAYRVEFNEGRLVKEGPIKCPKGKHGLVVTFAPSAMMGDITVTAKEILDLTWHIVHLCKVGTTINFNYIDMMGRQHKEVIVNNNGISEIISGLCTNQLIPPIHFVYDNGTMKLEALLSYDLAMDEPQILGFANMCPTSAGTHMDGFLDATVKYFRDYMNKIYLAGNKKMTVNAQDIKTGLRAVVSAFHLHPMFTGQSKEIFSKEDMKEYAFKVTLDAITEWTKKSPNDLQKICKYLKQVCEARMKADNEKIKISSKYKSVVTGLPDKYIKPNGRDNIEVYITEGQSAGGGSRNNRDQQHQGIMPIRGKICNAFVTPPNQYFKNEEVAGLFNIFGYSDFNNKKFDPSKFKPSKVIIATDADPDGAHIRSLLFGMFLRYLPFVITEGKLYAATPPLYGAKIKGKTIFFNDTIDYVEYVQDAFCKENSVMDGNGRRYTKKEIVKILYDNMDYVKYINKVCSTYAIEPHFFEFLLLNRNLPFKKFSSVVRKAYPNVIMEQHPNLILISGLVEDRFHTIFFGDKILEDSKEIINSLTKTNDRFIINGVPGTLYDLMLLVNRFKPTNITRYKGLGEMNPEDLGKSTILPGSRTLKQYTIQDVKKELDFITELQSDKSAFIKNVSIRKEDIV